MSFRMVYTLRKNLFLTTFWANVFFIGVALESHYYYYTHLQRVYNHYVLLICFILRWLFSLVAVFLARKIQCEATFINLRIFWKIIQRKSELIPINTVSKYVYVCMLYMINTSAIKMLKLRMISRSTYAGTKKHTDILYNERRTHDLGKTNIANISKF